MVNVMPTQLTRTLRYCVALCLVTLASGASANCVINFLTSADKVKQVFKENNGYEFRNYDLVCSKLRKANARISIIGSYGVLANRSFGWANISVADNSNGYFVVNDFGTNNTTLNEFASDDKARQLLWVAINNALNDWSALDQALAELKKARQVHKSTLR